MNVASGRMRQARVSLGALCWHRPWPALLVDGDEGSSGFRDLDHLSKLGGAFGEGFQVQRQGGAADPHHAAVAAEQVAHVHGVVELEGVHRHGDHPAAGAAAGEDAAGQVHLRHDPAAEDVAGGIGVGRHGQHADGRLGAGKDWIDHAGAS